jgi:hypothetical protein
LDYVKYRNRELDLLTRRHVFQNVTNTPCGAHRDGVSSIELGILEIELGQPNKLSREF